MPSFSFVRSRVSFRAASRRISIAITGVGQWMLALVACVGLLAPSAVAQTAHSGGNVVTLGNGFSAPYSVAVDASGNIFVADTINSQVKEIVAAGGYTTVRTLGNGFNLPIGVAVDPKGDVFVADYASNTVTEILAVGGAIPASSPTVRTLGSGFSAPFGITVDANGNVFVTDNGSNSVKEILAVGGVIPASSPTIRTLGSGFSNPFGIAVDTNGNVFVADNGNASVKEILAVAGTIPASSPTIHTVGSGFSNPSGVALDANGNVFVVDQSTTTVKEIVAGGGYTTMLTLSGSFSGPFGVTVDQSGNVFVADTNNNAVKEIVSANVNFGSASVATATPVTIPLTFTFDTGGTILAPAVLTQGATGLDFTDAGTGTCAASSYSMGATCTVNVTFVPKAPGIRYGAATLSNSSGTVIATAYVSGVGTGPQVTFSPGVQSTLNIDPSSPGGPFSTPGALAMDGNANLFVADISHNAVKKVLAAGGYTTVQSVGSGFSSPQAVAVDGAGNVFVADYGNNAVKEILAAGGMRTIGSYNRPAGVALDVSGNLFISENGASDVKEALAVSGYTTIVTVSTAFSYPGNIVTDGSGNLFVADNGNSAVKEVLAASGYTTVSTLGSGFIGPLGLSVDLRGNVFVADSNSNGVKEILAAGGYTIVKTIGSGFSLPIGVYVDGTGNVFVSNQSANTIVKLDYADPPSLSFASTQVGATSSDSPKTVTLVNSGNTALTFPPPATGLNPSVASGFTFGNSSTCPQLSTMSSAATLAAGASCTELISFSPTVPGSISGSLVTTDNALNVGGPSFTTQSVALSGTATGTAPTIVFTVPGHTFGDAPFTVSASSNSTGAFTYSVVSGPATISGATVTLTGAGTVVLQASEASDSNYLSGSSNGSFAVAAAAPVITFTVPGHTFGDAPFAVSASSNSSGAFTYSVVSGPATLSGSMVTLTGAGTVILQASEASDSNYVAGTQSVTFVVAAATPTIAFAVPGHTFGDAAFAVSASSNSSGAFTYTVVSGPATVSGATVTLTGAGMVVLQATEASDSNYVAGTQSATFVVAAGTPAITFAVPGHTFGDAPFVVSASSNSSGAFTYTVVSGPATVSGAAVTLTGAGTVVLQAAEASTANYVAGTQSATFAVAAATPTITFSVPGHSFGDAPFAVSANSNSTGAFTYSVVSGPATVSGATVTVTGVGTVVVQASEAATANYVAASSTATFAVVSNAPTIVFAVPGHIYGDAPFAVSASSNSTGAFTYTVVSGPATVSGATVTVTGVGVVTLQASEAATASFAAASSTATFSVAPSAPAIVFTVPNHVYGDAPFAVSASSNSTGALVYTVVSGPATIAGTTVTLTSAGTVVLQVSEAASANYAAGSATTAFTVSPSIALTAGSSFNSPTETVPPGTAATFALTFSSGGGAAYPNPLLLSVSGLPAGATGTFLPATIPGGTANASIFLVVQTSTQTARNEKPAPGAPFAPVALALLLLPLAGVKSVRRRLRHLPSLLALLLFTGAVLGLSGCGSVGSTSTSSGKSYALTVTATDTVTGLQTSTNVTLVVR